MDRYLRRRHCIALHCIALHCITLHCICIGPYMSFDRTLREGDDTFATILHTNTEMYGTQRIPRNCSQPCVVPLCPNYGSILHKFCKHPAEIRHESPEGCGAAAKVCAASVCPATRSQSMRFPTVVRPCSFLAMSVRKSSMMRFARPPCRFAYLRCLILDTFQVSKAGVRGMRPTMRPSRGTTYCEYLDTSLAFHSAGIVTPMIRPSIRTSLEGYSPGCATAAKTSKKRDPPYRRLQMPGLHSRTLPSLRRPKSAGE